MKLLKKIGSSILLSTILMTNIAPSYASHDLDVGEVNNTILTSEITDIGEERSAPNPESLYYKTIDNGIKGIHEQMVTGAVRQMLNGEYKVEPRDDKPGFSLITLNNRYFNMRGKYTYKEIFDMAYHTTRMMSSIYHKGSNQTFYFPPIVDGYDSKGKLVLDENDRIYQTLITIRFTVPTYKLDTIKKERQWIRDFSNNQLKGKSKYQKMVIAHDWIVDNSYYNLRDDEDDTTVDSIYDSYTIIKKGFGVCNAYASLFQKILIYNDIRVLFIQGDSYQSGEPVGHVWNKVYVDGKWQNIDVTWDDPVGNTIKGRKDYFLVPDSAFEGKRDFKYTYWPRG